MSSASLENSRLNFTFYPLLWLAISFASGIFFSNYFNFDWKIYFFVTIIFAVLTIAFLRKSFAHIFILISFVAVGGFFNQSQKQNEPKNFLKNLYDSKKLNSGDSVELEGILQGKPELSVGGFSILVDAERLIYKGKTIDVSGKARLFASVQNDQVQTEYDDLALSYGTRIRVAINLNREEQFLNPGGVSFLEILDQKDIQATASIKSPLLIERLDDVKTFSPFFWIYDYRQDLIQSIRNKFNVSTSGILIASMLGNRNYLTKETAETFREGGTFHVLVISGLHITFIGGILLLIVRYFTRKRLWQFVITSLALWVYSFAVGAEIPVIRAALMFTILLFSFVIYRRGTLLNALGACAFIILLWRPEDFYNQSFHLTFASLVGIIGVAFPLIEKLRSIGGWMPSAETPFPPDVHKKLKIFCETIYWSERKWQKTLNENVWDCAIFKSDYGKWLEERGMQKFLRWVFEGILVTAIVQLFLLPFLILYFHRLSFASVLLNLWVGIFVVLQNLTAIIALLFAQISDILALPIIKLSELFNWFLMVVPNLFIESNLASIRVPIYTGEMKAVYVLYFLPLIILTFFLNKWTPFSSGEWKVESRKPEKRSFKEIFTKKQIILFHFFTFSLFAFLIIFHPFSSPQANGKLTVDFLDVGQGDSALITFPNGATMLVDGGGRFNFNELYIEREDGEKEVFEPDNQGVGETVVSELLWEKGYSSIDYIVATHADADHIQGLIDVAKNFKVKTAIIGREISDDEDFTEFIKMLKRKNIQMLKLSRDDFFEIGKVKIEALNPISEESRIQSSSNNDSLVLRLVFGSREFLLTGDIEKETEKTLLENSLLLESDIVKVAHHGSRTSSTQEFIEATKAEYAIIPVGRKSRFGHPHNEVVERWKKSGARVLTTGEGGTITISTDGKNLEIQTFLKQ